MPVQALTPSFLMNVESRMMRITENEYARLNEPGNLWWQALTKVRQSTGRRDVIQWLLSTALIRDQGKGGNITFDDLVSTFMEIENKFSGNGLEITRAQFEDSDGGGVDLAAGWSQDTGAQMAYWPQKQAAYLLKNGHTAAIATGYDKKAYFATDHPFNPFAPNYGTYANLLTGGASGSYPGACPIDVSQTADVALQNLSKIFAYIATWKMPNGEDPRFLRPAGILCPPTLYPRAVQLTNAAFIAQAAGSGAASADVKALIGALGYSTPMLADELSGFENETTFFVICKQIATSQLGGLIYTERDPFRINYYGTVDQVELSRKQKFEWHNHGRNVMSPGHPYLIIKCKGS